MSTEYLPQCQLTYPLPPPVHQQWPTWYYILAPPPDINVLPLMKAQVKPFTSRTQQVMASHPQNKFIPHPWKPHLPVNSHLLISPSTLSTWMDWLLAHIYCLHRGWYLIPQRLLLFEDVRKEYVECQVEHVIIKLCILEYICLNYFSFYVTRHLKVKLSLKTLILTFCISQHMSLPLPRLTCC